MSNLVSKFKIFEKTKVIKNDIKYYHVFEQYCCKRRGCKCALFVTNNDKVYGINIPHHFMTPSYIRVIKQRRENKNFDELEAIEIEELCGRKIKEFHIDDDFILAINEDNKLYSWGNNKFCQLGRSTKYSHDYKPTEIIYFTNSRSKIKQIYICSETIFVLLDNGKVVVWGFNHSEYSSIAKRRSRNQKLVLHCSESERYNYWKSIREPKELYSLNEIEFINFNEYVCFVIYRSYNIFSCENFYDVMRLNKRSHISKPGPCQALSKLKIITIKNAIYVTYFLSSDGKLYICEDHLNLSRIRSKEYFIQLETIPKIVALSEKQIVYEVNGKELMKTEYKSFEEYSVMKLNKTFTTFIARYKFSNINLKIIIGNGAYGRVYKVLLGRQYYALKKSLFERR